MTDQEIIDWLNGQWPNSVITLTGLATGFDQNAKQLTMSFEAVDMFCHSGDIVQGGYITGMLDAAMAYAVIGLPETCSGVATLEIKVNFLRVGNPGPMAATGRVVHLGRSIAYLDGELHQNGQLIATATSTVKLIRAKV